MEAVAAVVERARPVTFGGVAGAGEAEHVSRNGAGAKKLGQLLVDFTLALAVAPVGHDDGTGNDAGALLASPADGGKERLRMLDVPVGEDQFGVGSDGVDDLGAENPVLIVFGLQVAVGAE
jgi:hypothetical protein